MKPYTAGCRILAVSLLCLSLMCAPQARAQTVTAQISGLVTDDTGAVVPAASVLIVNQDTGVSRSVKANEQGVYTAPALQPGRYRVTVEAKGFQTLVTDNVTLNVAQDTTLAFQLKVGSEAQTVTVDGSGIQVNSTSTESGIVITQSQIEHLAIVGRNVMDLAQLAPGVQLRDGSDIDPTKNNFTIAAFQGRSGRETQVQWDGLSIQDHTVGGPVLNVGLDAIQEFQVAQSTLHPAQSVASGGAVNMVSRTGANTLHGSAFDFFRDSRLGAKEGIVRSPYDRNQYGGRVGGAVIPNKFFYFLNAEANNTRDSYYGNTPFPDLNGFYPKKFTETFTMGRLDYSLSEHWKAFGRYSYGENNGVVGFPSLGDADLDPLTQKTHANVFGVSLSYAGARSFHTFSYGYNTYSQALISDPSAPTPLDANGRPYLIQLDGGASLSYGPNSLASQFQKQHTYQGKYDGSIVLGRHTLSYGVDMTHWVLGAHFSLYSNGPSLSGYTFGLPETPSSPDEYPLVSATFSNKLGYQSTAPALGYPAGGIFQWRPAVYIHDSWKLSPRLTINGGVRWTYLRGQFDETLNRGTLLDQFHPGYGGYRHTPKTNFGPQLGVSFDPSGEGKTVIRSAAGLYVEELTFDGFLTDENSFVPASLGQSTASISSGSALTDPRTGVAFVAGDPLATSYGFANGTSGTALAPLFSETIHNAAAAINHLNDLYVAAAAQNTTSASTFELTHQITSPAFTAGVKNPKVFQYNVALQHELQKGVVFTGEFVWVHGYDFPLAVDENHIGSAMSADFDTATAANAIALGNASVGCPASDTTCAISNGATIATYGGFGLGSGYAAQGYAFRGINSKFGQMLFLEHKAYNTYKGMNLRLDAMYGRPRGEVFAWMKSNSVTIGYTLASNTGNLRTAGTSASDPSAFASAWDNTRPFGFHGPDGLDRKNMLNASTITNIAGGFYFSQITHWYSPMAQNILIPVAYKGCAGGPEEIFCSDVTGDGTTNDLLPTAGAGAFDRSVKGATGLNKVISKYNNSYAGTPTPAGNLVVAQGLVTSAQLQQLGGVMPFLSNAPTGQVGLDFLLLTDNRLSYHRTLFERVSVEPSFDAFNVFNRTSYDPPGNLLNGNLYGTQGSINGTVQSDRTNVRQRGSGTFEQGARRQMQAGLRISF